jgi:hypothetical protein
MSVPDVDPSFIDFNASFGSDCPADNGERHSRWTGALDSLKSRKTYATKLNIFNGFCQTQPPENTVIMNVVQWIKHRCEEKDSSGKACHRPTTYVYILYIYIYINIYTTIYKTIHS